MKKRLLSILITLCLLITLPCTFAFADAEEDALSVRTEVDGAAISMTVTESGNFLFLPASADLKNFTLTFEKNGVALKNVLLTGELGKVSADKTFDLKTVAGKDKLGRYVLSAQTETGEKIRIHIMQGTGLPTLYLTSAAPEEDRLWVDSSKENKAKGEMLFIDENGEKIHSAPLTQIKTRGNTTFAYFPKKAYQIKLDKKADLLGNGEKEKTWVLLASYGDATLMRDKTFKDLAKEMGMTYAANCEWVNLYYDGEYRGVYTLGEKVDIGSAGIDITNMEDAYEEINENYGDNAEQLMSANNYRRAYVFTKDIVDPKDTGVSFLIELNHDYIDEACGFFTKQDVGFNLKTPEYAGQETLKYISEYYQAFEDAVYATDKDGNYTGYNEETGKYYYEYCDLESLVQMYLLQQLSSNVDAFLSSFFFYKDVDGLMYAGPMWDMDISCGGGWNEDVPVNWEYVNERYLAKALCQIPHFQKAVERYFAMKMVSEAEEIVKEGGVLDIQKELLAPSAAMNYTLWPYVNIGFPENPDHLWAEGTTYTTVTDDMQSWLTTRLAILKYNFHYEDWLKSPEGICFSVSQDVLNNVQTLMMNK